MDIDIMKLWIARDTVGWLGLYKSKPTFEDDGYGGYWKGDFMDFIDNGSNITIFPEITFENSPQEVELKLVEK